MGPRITALQVVLAVACALIVAMPISAASRVEVAAPPPSATPAAETPTPAATLAVPEERALLGAAIDHGIATAISAHPDFSFPAWQVLLAGVVAGAIAGLCEFATGALGSVGCIYLGLLIAAGIAAYLYFSALTALQSEASVLYYPAESAFSQLLETLQNNVSQTSAIAANVGELTDALTGLYGYEASAASGEQLPSDTFNQYLDLIDSGAAGQMLSEVDGVSVGLWADLAGFFRSMDNLYGPTGRFGADGLVCMAEVNGTYRTSNTTHGQSRFFDYGPIPEVAGANYNFGPDGGCNEDEGADQIGPVTFADNATGIGLPINASYSAEFLATHSWAHPQFTTDLPLYIAPNATFSAAAAPYGPVVPLLSAPGTGACSGAAPCLQMNLTGPVTIEGDGATFAFDVTADAPTKFTGTPGLYYLVNESNCNVYCGPADPADNYLIGTNVLPFDYGSTSQEEKYQATVYLAGTSQVTYQLSDTVQSAVIYACGTTLSNQSVRPVTSDTYIGTNLTPVNTCPVGIADFLGEVESEMQGAADVGEAYWTFMHGLGVYQESTVPASCEIPTPADFLPPDTPLAEIITFGANDIANLMDAYIVALGNDYYSQSLNSGTFCGYHIPPPGTITLNDPGWAFIGDIYTHTDSQFFETPSTWYATNVGMDILPQDGNLTIPVGSLWEAPAANPSLVYYGPTLPPVADLTGAKVSSAVINLSAGGVISALEGNSTDRQGSIYPSQTDDRLGAGDALYLDACWHNESGTWKSVSACYDNVTVVHYIEPNGSSGCYFQGKCSTSGSGGFPLPQVPNCGWIYVDDIAQYFATVSLGPFAIGDAFACVIAWLLMIAVIGAGVLIAVAVLRSATKKAVR